MGELGSKIFSSRDSVPIADAGLQLEVLSLVEPMDPWASRLDFPVEVRLLGNHSLKVDP